MAQTTEQPPTTGDIRSQFSATGPGTLAGRWLRSFWQPVYRVKDLVPGRAVPLRVMGEDLTLYRGEPGEFHLLGFRCAHRGTQLSTGWVEGDTLRCFYHGWRYEGSGQCIEQPAEPEPFCEKIRVPSYPLYEYLGLIFAYLGDEMERSAERPRDPASEHAGRDGRPTRSAERPRGPASEHAGRDGRPTPPPRPSFPEFEDDSRGWLDSNRTVIPCNYFNVIDNDPIHYYFVHYHAASTGRGGLPTITATETVYGFANRATDSNGSWEYHFHMPNLTHNRRDGRPSGEALRWIVPIDDENTVSISANLIYHTPEGEEYRQRLGERRPTPNQDKVRELGHAILRGEMHISDVEDRGVLFNVQDFIAYVGQGVTADITQQRLGQEDAGVALLRTIWARELSALAEGRPTKEWRRPDAPLLMGHTAPSTAPDFTALHPDVARKRNGSGFPSG